MKIEKDLAHDNPPVLGKWKNFYWLLIIVLLSLIGIFYAITQYFE